MNPVVFLQHFYGIKQPCTRPNLSVTPQNPVSNPLLGSQWA